MTFFHESTHEQQSFVGSVDNGNDEDSMSESGFVVVESEGAGAVEMSTTATTTKQETADQSRPRVPAKTALGPVTCAVLKSKSEFHERRLNPDGSVIKAPEATGCLELAAAPGGIYRASANPSDLSIQSANNQDLERRKDRDLSKTRERTPRFLAKRTRRQRNIQAKMKLAVELAAAAKVEDFGNSAGNNVIDIDALCLSCEDAAYDGEFFRIIDNNFADRHGARSAANLIPLRNKSGQTELLWVHSTVVGDC